VICISSVSLVAAIEQCFYVSAEYGNGLDGTSPGQCGHA